VEEDYMKKKILIVSILAVFMLVAISFASAVSTQTANTTKKESPLFRIRTRKAIGERLQELKENIKARFIGERVFFLPFQWIRNKDELSVRNQLAEKILTTNLHTCNSDDFTCQHKWCTSSGPTCEVTSCVKQCSTQRPTVLCGPCTQQGDLTIFCCQD
jgi:hypothetical protein